MQREGQKKKKRLFVGTSGGKKKKRSENSEPHSYDIVITKEKANIVAFPSTSSMEI